MKKAIAACVALTLLTACQHPGQNQYSYQDVGKVTRVMFGTIVSHRPVQITGQNHGVGATTGALGGTLAGSYVGGGGGSLGAMLAGALIAGVAGHMAEQAVSDYRGVEFVVALENSEILTVVQTAEPAIAGIREGDRVMVQTSGQYQRILPANHLPNQVKKAKRIKVVD